MIRRPTPMSGLAIMFLAMTASAVTSRAESARGSIPARLTLPIAEDLLLERNLAVAAQRYRVDVSRAATLIARYKPNPILTVSAEQFATLPPFGSLSRSSRFLFTRTDTDAAATPSYSVGLEKLVERGGKRELRASRADVHLKTAEADLLDSVRRQLFELRSAFVEAKLARENLVLARRTLQEYQRIQSLTEVRVQAGEAAGAELYRVRAGELEHHQAVLLGRIEYETGVREILRVLGTRAEEVEAPAVQVATQSGTGAVFAQLTTPSREEIPLEILGEFINRRVSVQLPELRKKALSSRPDVLATRHRLEAAGISLDLTRALRVRDVSVGAAFERVGSDNTFGLTLQIPLFVHHRYEAAVEETLAEHRASEMEARRTELEALTEVEKAYQEYLMAREILEVYDRQNLEQLERLQRIALFTYREGASSMLELLDAQRAYNQTMSAYNEARARYELSLYGLEHAVGAPLLSPRSDP